MIYQLKIFGHRFLFGVCAYILKLLKFNNRLQLAGTELSYAKVSYSQFGEDLIILQYLRKQEPQNHIYVDVGAFHPVEISNTFLLHKRGWRGINIDLDVDKMERFQHFRPGDFNIAVAVSDTSRDMRVLRYNIRATNRLVHLSESTTTSVLGEEPTGTEIIQTQPLANVIEASPLSNYKIGFLNIDAEGHDYHVLRGLNIEKYRPLVIATECHSQEYRNVVQGYLSPFGYSLASIVHGTNIFVHNSLEY